MRAAMKPQILKKIRMGLVALLLSRLALPQNAGEPACKLSTAESNADLDNAAWESNPGFFFTICGRSAPLK